jgi:hypothetical protein
MKVTVKYAACACRVPDPTEASRRVRECICIHTNLAGTRVLYRLYKTPERVGIFQKAIEFIGVVDFYAVFPNYRIQRFTI